MSRFTTKGVRPVKKPAAQPRNSEQKTSSNGAAQANSSVETPEKLGTPPTGTSSPVTKPLIPIKRMNDLQGQTRIFLSGGPAPKAR